MMEWARQWLLGLVSAALLCALITALLPKTGAGRVGRLAAGLLMALAMLGPLTQVLPRSAAEEFRGLGDYIARREEELSQQRDETMKEVIQQETEAYILDKGAQLGAELSVSVTCRMGEEGVWLPEEAVIRGSLTEEQRSALTQWLDSQLAIPVQRQIYQSEEAIS